MKTGISITFILFSRKSRLFHMLSNVHKQYILEYIYSTFYYTTRISIQITQFCSSLSSKNNKTQTSLSIYFHTLIILLHFYSIIAFLSILHHWRTYSLSIQLLSYLTIHWRTIQKIYLFNKFIRLIQNHDSNHSFRQKSKIIRNIAIFAHFVSISLYSSFKEAVSSQIEL